MATDIGVKATGDREAVERIARKRGMTAAAVMRKERARMRALFGRGALYRADIMGDCEKRPRKRGRVFLAGRDITRSGRMEPVTPAHRTAMAGNS